MRRREFRKLCLFTAFLIAGLVAPGCGTDNPKSQRPAPTSTGQVQTGPVTLIKGWPTGTVAISREGRTLLKLNVEFASSPVSRAEGLMGVESMPRDVGMVFEYGNPHRGPFYMKNTLIPLDIAFWNEEGTIVDILQMQPCKADPCPLYHPSADYISAVEVNLGVMNSEGVEVGDRVEVSRKS